VCGNTEWGEGTCVVLITERYESGNIDWLCWNMRLCYLKRYVIVVI
jgi:hypothetical protein